MILKPKPFNVKILYIYKFISECLPIYAFYTVLFLERGQSFTDVAVLIALWSVFAIIFEFPSGVIADRWNRRNMLAIGTAIQGLCFVVWFFSHTFFMFALGFALWGISGAFTSGTEEGLIFDNLKSDGREKDFTKIYGKGRSFANAGAAVGIGSAGIVAMFIDIEYIALISAGICLINVIFALQIREKNFYAEKLAEEADEEKTGFFDTFKQAGAFVKGNRIAIVVIFFLVLFANLGGYLDEFDAFIIVDFELSYIWVSVIMTIRLAFVALGNLLAPRVQKRLSSMRKESERKKSIQNERDKFLPTLEAQAKVATVRAIFLLNGVACAILLGFSMLWSEFAILVFGISFMLMAITEVLLVNVLQNEIKEEGRATVMSFYSIGLDVMMICVSLIFALLTGLFTLQQVYVIISIFGIVGGVCFYLFLRKR